MLRPIVIALGLILGLSPTLTHGQSEFRRGDADGDGRVTTLADVQALISGLFSAGPVPCGDAHDVNDDGLVDIVDAVDLLVHAYGSTDWTIPAPGPFECGPDPTPDFWDCDSYSCDDPEDLTPDPDLVYRVVSRVGAIGTVVGIEIQVDHTADEGLTTCSFGLAHDPGRLSFAGAQAGTDLDAEPDFLEVREEPDRIAVALIPSILFFEVLEPGVERELLRVDYELLAPGSALVEFVDDVGNLTLANHGVRGYQLVRPVTESGEITVVDEPIFRRGDANLDGQFDVADPVFGLMYLFAAGAPPLCEDAGDSNDDGSLDVSDAVHMLTALFEAGSAPPAPGPLSCDLDPTDDSLGCDSGCE